MGLTAAERGNERARDEQHPGEEDERSVLGGRAIELVVGTRDASEFRLRDRLAKVRGADAEKRMLGEDRPSLDGDRQPVRGVRLRLPIGNLAARDVARAI